MNELQTQQLESIKKIASIKGGECLSIEYVNSHEKLIFKCKNNHEWSATPTNIKRNRWCPYCANKSKDKSYHFENLKKIIENKNGLLLSNCYISAKSKIKIKCKNNHIFEMTADNIKHNEWCPYCIRHKILNPLEELKSIAIIKGGICLSNIYIDSKTKLEFKCKNNHTWFAVPRQIIFGTWCPYCAGHKLINPLQEIQDIAISKGGKCLSTTYINNSTKMNFICKEGHTWKAEPHNIKLGKWCPRCNVFIAEEICRAIFELAFEKEFKKVRIIPNVNTGHYLELDGYNEELKIAFEYNGEQHYKDNIFVQNSLNSQIQRDTIKAQYCKDNNITLIIIPHIIKTSSTELYTFIQTEYCKITQNNFPIIDVAKIDINSLYNRSKLEEIKEVAISKNGKCLSDKYINSQTKLEFECDKGHKWKSTSANINYGKWCPHCAVKNRKQNQSDPLGLEKIKEYARSKNGLCLSNNYINAHYKLKFQCEEGHVWIAKPIYIKKGSWCPICTGNSKDKKANFEVIKKIVEDKGGECLSTEYISAKTKMKFKCAKGHIWDTTPDSIKSNNTWCPYCSGRKK